MKPNYPTATSISLLCPSRGRPEQFKRMVDSARETADESLEILGFIDSDDDSWPQYPYCDDAGLMVVIGPNSGLAPGYRKLFTGSHGDIVMLAADDLVFKTKGWDTKVKEAMPKDLIGAVSFDDKGGPRREHGHPFIGRKLIDLMGYVCHPKLSHSCVDNWVVDIAKAVGRFVYLDDVVIEHMHPKYQKGEWDRTYKENTKEVKARDGKFYKHDGREELRQTIKRVYAHLND